MSCTTTEDIRIIMKYSTIAGATPTIPESDDHTDGTWLPTDLYIGEFFVNTQDNLVWIRTEAGITPVGSTAGTASFIGDYVHISGGTYSGQIYAPTVSTTDLVSVSIDTTQITADYFYGGTFSGDGSLLTGIIASWTGGTVSNPVYFTGEFVASGDTYLDGDIKTNNSLFNFTAGLTVSGNITSNGVFYGDGSGLTNLPTGTYSDIYTISATLSGNEILFTRNDSSTYQVDLTPILATAGVADMYWNDAVNTLYLELNDGTTIETEINSFDNISALNTISAPEFYGGTFYGTFTGTFSDDIYTTGAYLSGSTAIFDRSNGSSYSLDLSGLTASGGTTYQFITEDVPSKGFTISITDGSITNFINIDAPLATTTIKAEDGTDISFIDLQPYGVLTSTDNGTDNSSVYLTPTSVDINSTNGTNTGQLDITDTISYLSQDNATDNHILKHDLTGEVPHSELTVEDASNQSRLWVAKNQTYLQSTDNVDMGRVTAEPNYVEMTSYDNTTNVSAIGVEPTQNSLSVTDGSNTNQIQMSSTASYATKIINYATDLSGQYEARTLVDKGYIDGLGIGVISDTYANIQTLKSTDDLKAGSVYHINDKGIWIKAISNNKLDISGTRVLPVILNTIYEGSVPAGYGTFQGTFYDYDGYTPVFSNGDYCIWGGKVWLATLSGGATLSTSIVDAFDLDTVGGTLNPIGFTFSDFYTDFIFDVDYDFDNDKVINQWDLRGNHIYYSDDIALDYSAATDWGNSRIFNNSACGILNNSANMYIFGNKVDLRIDMNYGSNLYYNTAKNINGNFCDEIMYNVGSGPITNNKATSPTNMLQIRDNKFGEVGIYNNIVGSYIRFNKVDRISSNTVDAIVENSGLMISSNIANAITENNVRLITSNNMPSVNIGGNIGTNYSNNTCGGSISNNNVNIVAANSHQFVIEYNTGWSIISCGANVGTVSHNIVNEIADNNNTGDISNNSIANMISDNTNTGNIINNISVNIMNNTNTGNIVGNNTSGDLYNNSNVGNINYNKCIDISNNNSNVVNISNNIVQDGIYDNSNTGDIIYNITETINNNI